MPARPRTVCSALATLTSRLGPTTACTFVASDPRCLPSRVFLGALQRWRFLLGGSMLMHIVAYCSQQYLQRHADSTAFSAACSPTVRTWLDSLPRTVGRLEPPQGRASSTRHRLERLSDLHLNRRKRVALGDHWSNADGLASATLRERASEIDTACWAPPLG